MTLQTLRIEAHSDKATEHSSGHQCERANSFDSSLIRKQAFIRTWQFVPDQLRVDLTFEQSIFERNYQRSPFPTYSRGLGERISIINGTGLRTYFTSAACQTSDGKQRINPRKASLRNRAHSCPCFGKCNQVRKSSLNPDRASQCKGRQDCLCTVRFERLLIE